MRMRVVVLSIVSLASAAALFGQSSQPAALPQYSDPMTSIAIDLRKISGSVQMLSERMKSFVDKFEKVGGLTLTEKQQRLVLGMEMLIRAEQRVATLQKSVIELTEKLNQSRSRLSQVESDLRPRNIDRSVALEGTTEAEELRESRRQRLQAERLSLSQLVQQIQGDVAEATDNLREAQALAGRLRRLILPQIEREMYEQ